MTDETLIFLHIKRTGGTSLWTMLWKPFPGGCRCLIYEEGLGKPTFDEFTRAGARYRASFELIGGHMNFGLHCHIPQPCRYFTFMRPPVERVVSLHYHHRKEGDAPCRATLEEFIATQAAPEEIDNGMTRALSGQNPPFGECDESMLVRACENIDRHFAFVGLTQRFEESVSRLENTLGVSLGPAVRVNNAAPALLTPNRTILDEIEQLNGLDLLLYKIIARRFDQTS